MAQRFGRTKKSTLDNNAAGLPVAIMVRPVRPALVLVLLLGLSAQQVAGPTSAPGRWGRYTTVNATAGRLPLMPA